MFYYYENKTSSPDLFQIQYNVSISNMTDKTIEWCRWDKETNVLQIKFTNELKPSDKLILDDLVFQNS